MKNSILNKLVSTLCGFVLVINFATAQTDFSIKIANSFDISEQSSQFMNSKSNTGDVQIQYLGRTNTYSVGARLKKSYGFIFGSVGVDYRKTGFDYALTTYLLENPSVKSDVSVSRSSIFVPVLAGLKLNNFNFSVGPVFDFVVNESINDDATTMFNSSDIKQYTQFQFAVGYEFFNRVELGASYERALYQVKNQFKIEDAPSKLYQSPNMVSLSLAVKLN